MDEPNDRVILDFLGRFLADRAAREVHPLSTYLAAFPGHEEAVAQAYLERVRGDTSREARTHPEEAHDPAAPDGDRQIGRFRILEEIGRGGQGIVYRAEDVRLKRPVALKVLGASITRSRDHQRLQREAEIASRLDDPGICTIHEIGTDDQGETFIAMRFVEGASLAQELASRSAPPASLREVEEILDLIEKVARSLHVAHQGGVIHRDVKPANIMITVHRDPVLLDFGLARDDRDTASALTLSGDLLGTPTYMSPQQVDPSRGPVDCRTDVYSLGVTLFQALTGRVPFEAPTVEALVRQIADAPVIDPRKLNPALSRDVATVTLTAMERDLGGRYRSALDFAEDLARVRRREPIHARPAGPLLRFRRWASRNPRLATTTLLLFLVLVTGLALISHFWRRAERRFEDFLQVSDVDAAQALIAESEELHPAGPGLVPRCSDWLQRSDALLDRRKRHESSLRELRASGAKRPDGEAADPDALGQSRSWLEKLLGGLLDTLDELERRRFAILDRRERSLGLVGVSIVAHRAEWEACTSDIAASETYDYLEIEPQCGLVPLGRHPRTGLWEFWHQPSGSRPHHDEAGQNWVLELGSGMVFVLLPGGRTRIGDPARTRNTSVRDGPVSEVVLDAFFMSKYEMTQDQWVRIGAANPSIGDANPSHYFPGTERGSLQDDELVITLLHPVESVSWSACRQMARVLDLALPSEAQWEYAARAGSRADWCFGGTKDELRRYANVAGQETARRFWRSWPPTEADDHRRHAPVGSYRPNRFGLYDVHGNLQEWCADPFFRAYDLGSHREGDGLLEGDHSEPTWAHRGGSWAFSWPYSTVWARNYAPPDARYPELGVRYARSIRREAP